MDTLATDTSFFFQENSGQQVNVTLDILVTPVPEPNSLLLLVLAAPWFLRRRR